MSEISSFISYLETEFENWIQQLKEYSQIPSVSFEAYPKETLEDSAVWTANAFKKAGLENVEIIHHENAHPYVYADWMHAEGKPTVLLYGHHDVQPPGRAELWNTPAFTPTVLDDGRIYGRGVADDKAGVLMHLAALDAYLKKQGSLPVNVKFIVEGEEETGSAHLESFLKTYKEKLKADFIILTDTANLEEGLPSITYSLRGIVDCVLEVKTLSYPVHSGVWGGPALDAISVLSKLISSLRHSDGSIAVPGFYDDVPQISDFEKQNIASLPFNEEQFKKDLGLPSHLNLAGEKAYLVYEQLWLRPCLAVLGIETQDIKTTSNKIVEQASAKISIRVVAGQDPQSCFEKLEKHLLSQCPQEAEVTLKKGVANPGWRMNPEGPAFAAAAKALEKGYEKKAAFIGCGASIPFVGPFSEAFGGIPALLIGIEDPKCRAHGENESLSLSDWLKGMKSAVYLYEELGRIK